MQLMMFTVGYINQSSEPCKQTNLRIYVYIYIYKYCKSAKLAIILFRLIKFIHLWLRCA